jgi:hypothetical protein
VQRSRVLSNGVLAFFLAVLSLGGASSSVLASAPQDVTIVAGLTPGDSGPWSATGAINDSGTWLRTDLLLTGSIFHSRTFSSGHDIVVMTGADGSSFTLDNQVLFDGCCGFTGEWVVAGGTGIYAGLQGQGSLGGVEDPSGGQVVLQGQVHVQ